MENMKKQILEVFKNSMFRDLSKCEDPFSQSIFGEQIGLLPSEALFLLFELEKEFGIRFPNEVAAEHRFDILNDIVLAVKTQLEEK